MLLEEPLILQVKQIYCNLSWDDVLFKEPVILQQTWRTFKYHPSSGRHPNGDQKNEAESGQNLSSSFEKKTCQQ